MALSTVSDVSFVEIRMFTRDGLVSQRILLEGVSEFSLRRGRDGRYRRDRIDRYGRIEYEPSRETEFEITAADAQQGNPAAVSYVFPEMRLGPGAGGTVRPVDVQAWPPRDEAPRPRDKSVLLNLTESPRKIVLEG